MLRKFKYQPPPGCSDSVEVMKHKLCYNVCLYLFLSMILVIFMNYRFGFSQIESLQWIVCGIFGSLVLLFRYHKLTRQQTAVILLTTGAVFLSIVVSVTNTIQSPIMPWFCIIPLYAFWLLNGRHARLWFGIIVIIFLTFLYLFFVQYKPPSVYNYFEGNHGIYAVVGLMLLLLNIYIIGQDFEHKKKQAIDKINESNKELNEALVKLKEAKEKLEEAQKHKDIFIAQMSHEMRTPMNAIYGVSELLSSKEYNVEKVLVDILSKSSKQLLNIINDILDISKLQRGKFQMQNVVYLLDELIQDVYSYTMRSCEDKGLKMHFSINNIENSYLNGDPYRLRQILHNILSNAVKFTDSGEVGLEVDFREEKGLLFFRIWDTGIGMTEEELQRIFIPFSQANHSIHLKYGGTGIGLNICKQLIDLLGGTIRISSELNKGTEVNISMQVNVVNTQADAIDDEVQFVSADMKKALAGVRVLLAEDNEVNRIIFKELIKREIPEIVIHTAADGEEAVEKLVQASYDLVIMDIQMPRCDGFQATRLIREHELSSVNTVPVIALSAYARKTEIDECLKTGMNDYLAKPLNKNELVLKMYELLREKTLLRNNVHLT